MYREAELCFSNRRTLDKYLAIVSVVFHVMTLELFECWSIFRLFVDISLAVGLSCSISHTWIHHHNCLQLLGHKQRILCIMTAHEFMNALESHLEFERASHYPLSCGVKLNQWQNEIPRNQSKFQELWTHYRFFHFDFVNGQWPFN